MRIAAVGDVLLHQALQRRGFADPAGFRALWRPAEPVLALADIVYGNLEGPVAPGLARGNRPRPDPGAVFDGQVHSGYPFFNYHPSVIAGLKASGFDVVSTANNHAMDRGSRGADLTIAALRSAGMAYTGTIARGAPRAFAAYTPTPLGRIAWIACSYSTNGLADPGRQVLLCYRDRQELLALVRREAARGDVAGVIVTPHWGIEYSHAPDANQRRLARELAAAGATAVIGTHPHVIQPWDWLSGPSGRAVPVVYSTGNFVAAQGGLSRRTGIVALMELCRAPGGGLAVARAGPVPTLMRFTTRGPEISMVAEGATGISADAARLVSRIAGQGTLGARYLCRPG